MIYDGSLAAQGIFQADLIISAIKAGKSKQEAAKIDQMVRLFRSAASGKKR